MDTSTPPLLALAVPQVSPPSTCYLCGAPLPDADDCPLCPECEREEDAKWRDYLADREQKRWPY